MRKTLTLILVIVTSFMANSQPILYTVVTGDTVVLEVSGASGTIQWQQSTDSIIWTDIAGATTTPYELITTVSPTNKRYFRAKVEDNCPNFPWYSSIICQKVLTNTIQVQIGDMFHGGIVFYNDGSGTGLIAPQSDQSLGIEWGCYGTSISGTTSSTNGAANTEEIVTACSTRPIAASICNDLVLNNYEEWFLPSVDQLNLLYQQRSLVGPFDLGNFWSSTEYNATHAYTINFLFGGQELVVKNYGFSVRCVGAFSPTVLSKTYCYADVTNQPISANIATQPVSQNNCFGSSAIFIVEATGTLPVTFQWKKDGVDISGETSNIYTINSLTIIDEGIYTCEVTNLCRSVLTNYAELKVIQLSADAGSDTRICNGQGTVISASAISNHPTESGNYSYSWSPIDGLSASNIYNPNASPTVTTDYTVQATDQLGCIATDVVNVMVQNAFQNEEICMVTIDTTTWKNKIIWEKTANVGTSSFGIYKEISTNTFGIIGNVQYDSSSFYIDYASNPESYGSKYKIAAIDTCGTVSDMSPYHKTMNLVISTFGTTMGLSWTEYEDESGSFIPGQYYIYRGSSSSNMEVIDSIPGSFTSYNDNNVDSSYYYMVGVKKPGGCNITKNSVLESFSNKKLNFGSGVNDYQIQSLSIYPNPANDKLNIGIEDKATLEILNMQGQIVDYIILTEKANSLDISNVASGVYTLRIKTDRGIAIRKLIKQ